MAGIHADYVLIIADEASGIPEQVYEAGAGSMSGRNAMTILAGNGIRGSGKFYDTHHRLRGSWTTFRVNSEDWPRAASVVQEFADDYGTDSNAYRVRVLGLFPEAEDDKIIPIEWLNMALIRDIVPAAHVRPVWGLDVARFGRDRSALAIRQGGTLIKPVRSWNGLDMMATVGQVMHEWNTTLPMFRPSDICVDAIGLGAGVADRLHELGLPARAINVSESAAMEARFKNLKAELWWKAREWFETKACTLGGHDGDGKRWQDEKLGGELSDVKYKFTSNDKVEIESKDEIKKRAGDRRSPDLADAFVLTFAGQSLQATYGSEKSPSWNQPIHRNVGVA
jgi:phage terminase large subunit